MRAEYDQRLREAGESHQANLAQVQRELAHADQARVLLEYQIQQQKEERATIKDSREVGFQGQLITVSANVHCDNRARHSGTPWSAYLS